MGLFDNIVGAGFDIVGGITGTKQLGEAAERAGELEAQAAQAGIAETRRQSERLEELLAPFTGAGVGALEQQQALLNLLGPEAQQAAISGIEGSPLFQSLVGQGEEALLQRASATGGLRGGNIQAALAQFRPQMLQQQIQQQFQNLGGLTSLGQASAAGVGAGGVQAGANIANLLGQKGQALAGGALGAGGTQARTFQDILSLGNLGVQSGLFGGGAPQGMFSLGKHGAGGLF